MLIQTKSTLFKRTALILLAGTLSHCGVNPVTKKREFQLVSEAQEIAIGQKNYSPARQSQGGDYTLDPELTAYVQDIGKRLGAVSDRNLPYEFVIINDSVPNAWAMPGGKIAFNRGLLYELKSEAELAAVMGHELVHAAARHGAKGMERGIFMQSTILAAGLATQDSNYANLIVGSAQLGAQLVTSKYGRDAESEADYFGMEYMKKAGYDPSSAVTLQETFVRLSAGKRSGLIDGLFASHPPSQARVDANKVTLSELGAGGDWGRETYAQKTANLIATKPAYDAYEAAIKALSEKKITEANTLIKKAIAIESREAKFQEFLGDIAMTQNRPAEAIIFYDKAIALQPGYFKPHVQGGIALFNLGRKAEAQRYLNAGNALLPTAPSHFLLGKLNEERGDITNALMHFEIAASSDSDIGKQSIAQFARLDASKNPARHLKASLQADHDGHLYAVVQNPTSLTVNNVRVRMVQYDANSGRAIGQSEALLIMNAIPPNGRGQIAVRGARISQQREIRLFKVVVEAAQVVK